MRDLWKRAFGAIALLLVVLLALVPGGNRTSIPGSDQAAGRAPQAGGQLLGGKYQEGVDPGASSVIASQPVAPALTQAVRDLPLYVAEYTLDREINPRLSYRTGLDPNLRVESGIDPLLAVQEAAPKAAPNAFNAPLLDILGQGYSGVNPPDTVGEVGPSHYVQMINGSGGAVLKIYNKTTGTTIAGPTALDSLGTGSCASGYGDPVVLYDQAAGRWLLSEFAQTGNHLCVYVSQTGDPAGAYYAYDFTTPTFPDYPKYAVWPDAYYVTSNESAPTVYALDRAKILIGAAATTQRFTAPSLTGFGFQALTPADLDGSTAPPAGAPGIMMRHRDTEVHGPTGYATQDILELWQLSVNWTTPASSTFTKVADILTAEFSSDLCGLTSFACIPQPGTTTKLDPLREVIMNRLAYRNFGTHQTLVGNLVTDTNGADRAGVRWFELRKTTGAWSLYQEGTYSPDATNRWMGAIAMDGAGNIALGYNVSASTAVYPGLRYAGRLATDPLGTLPQGEYTLEAGSSRNSSNRYGDYASMNIDPADDCTFWFTGEYNTATSWSTRIGSFKFDQCGGGPTPTPTNTPPPGPTATPTPTATSTPVPACTTFTSTDVPKNITNRANATSVVAVTGGTITDVNLTLGRITHTYDADLDIYIKHPDGTERMLSTDNGGAGDNYVSTVFDDEAATAVTSGAAPFTGSFRPEATLSIFDGKAAAGTWTLRVYDDSNGDTGSLQAWSITVCTGGALAAPANVPLEQAGGLALVPSTFSAKWVDGRVLLAWQATGAGNLAGFNLYRSATPDKRGDLLAFVPVNGKGVVYDYDDAKAIAGQAAWYTLEAVGANGAVVEQAVESVTPAASID